MRKLIGISEIIVTVGLILIFVGLYLYRPHLACTVCGFILLIIGILTAR